MKTIIPLSLAFALFAPSAYAQEEDVAALVIDNGSGMMKAALSSSSAKTGSCRTVHVMTDGMSSSGTAIARLSVTIEEEPPTAERFVPKPVVVWPPIASIHVEEITDGGLSTLLEDIGFSGDFDEIDLSSCLPEVILSDVLVANESLSGILGEESETAAEGSMPQTREHILLARQVGVPAITITAEIGFIAFSADGRTLEESAEVDLSLVPESVTFTVEADASGAETVSADIRFVFDTGTVAVDGVNVERFGELEAETLVLIGEGLNVDAAVSGD